MQSTLAGTMAVACMQKCQGMPCRTAWREALCVAVLAFMQNRQGRAHRHTCRKHCAEWHACKTDRGRPCRTHAWVRPCWHAFNPTEPPARSRRTGNCRQSSGHNITNHSHGHASAHTLCVRNTQSPAPLRYSPAWISSSVARPAHAKHGSVPVDNPKNKETRPDYIHLSSARANLQPAFSLDDV